MPEYRGFEGEVSLNGLGAAFSGPLVQAVQRAIAIQATTPVRAPAPAYVPTISPGLIDPGKILPGIPGDIRDITARTRPGEAIVDDPGELFDDMTAENGVPGVDDSGAFPYGDPNATTKPALVREGGNQGLLFMAAIAAALLLGG